MSDPPKPLPLNDQVVGQPVASSNSSASNQPQSFQLQPYQHQQVAYQQSLPPNNAYQQPVIVQHQQPGPAGPAYVAYNGQQGYNAPMYSQQHSHIAVSDPRDMWDEVDLRIGPSCIRDCCLAGWCPCLFVAETSQMVNDGSKHQDQQQQGGVYGGRDGRTRWWLWHAVIIGVATILKFLITAGYFVEMHVAFRIVRLIEIPVWIILTIVMMDWRRKVGEEMGIATERDDVCTDFICMCCFSCCFLPSVKRTVIRLTAVRAQNLVGAPRTIEYSGDGRGIYSVPSPTRGGQGQGQNVSIQVSGDQNGPPIVVNNYLYGQGAGAGGPGGAARPSAMPIISGSGPTSVPPALGTNTK